ncbi:MAG: alpha-hydroxy acid oxidase [Novosphingobium aromaticivorans]|nr:alpha-hydroxy acid oxidase [Novosphingobium aromaticivorans]
MGDAALPLRRYRRGGAVDRALSIAELRAMALHRLPAIAAEYLEGGAEEEVSLQANRAAFDGLRFRPRLAERAQGGQGFPYVIAPTGLNGLYWRGADMALARAAAAAGVPFTQSTVSNVRLEEIAAVPGIDHWFQLYLFSQMAMVEQLLARAAGAGVRTLVVTVDANTFGNREWNTRLYAAEARPSLAARLDVLRHPRWLAQVYRHGLPGFPNIAEWLGEGAGDLLQASQWLRRNIAPTVRWEELAQVRRLWSGRMLVKGIGHVADARRVMALGADGVVLGNHGGRQLDGAVSGMDLLAETREALGEKAMVLVEGGIRRGTDLLKAQRLGADAAMGGRATLYGVAVAGEAGAARALAILRQEYERSQILLGDGDVV